MKRLILLILLLYSSHTIAIDISPYKPGQELNNKQAKELQKKFDSRKEQAWKAPLTEQDIRSQKNANLVLHGKNLLEKTAMLIGPKAHNKSKRYSGNNLNCSSCHLKGTTQLPGTKKNAIPFTNISNDYPQFRGRNMSIVTAADRVNGCMTRSMGNGKPLPVDSVEMKSILAYFDWLAKDTEKNAAMEGTGLPKIQFPNRKADIASGEKVYQQLCISCHAKDGLGTKADNFNSTGSYTFPPVAGKDSFNNGAGMSRLKKATRFIYGNMPFGVSSDNPALTVEQAYDVAAYVLSLERSKKADRNQDFPNPDFRPDDYPVSAYFKGDNVALEKARLGPYKK